MLDLIAMLKDRLEHPQPLRSRASAARIGEQALRQLTEAPRKPGPQPITMSDLGKCECQLAHKRAGSAQTGHVGDWRARLTWMTGDAVEATLLTALAEALEGTKYTLAAMSSEDRQERVRLIVVVPGVGAVEVHGHPDAALLDAEGGIVMTVGCKSANPYAFDLWAGKIEDGLEPWGPDESYYWQAQGYIHAIGAAAEYEIVEDKSSGAVIGWMHRADPMYIANLQQHLAATYGDPASAPKRLPGGTELGPKVDLHKTRGTPNKAHGTLAWQCSYCAYWRFCWPTAQETVTWYPRPKRVLQIVQPEEVTNG